MWFNDFETGRCVFEIKQMLLYIGLQMKRFLTQKRNFIDKEGTRRFSCLLPELLDRSHYFSN